MRADHLDDVCTCGELRHQHILNLATGEYGACIVCAEQPALLDDRDGALPRCGRFTLHHRAGSEAVPA